MFAFAPDRLVHFRILAGLSREQLAVAAKVSGPSIVAYELGIRTPRVGVLVGLAERSAVIRPICSRRPTSRRWRLCYAR